MNQKGQVLLFVIVTMTIALALGIGVSLQTISTLSGVSSTDTSQKALASAEGAAERVLTLSDEQLEAFVDGSDKTGTCELLNGSYIPLEDVCYFETAGETTNENINTEAKVSIERFNYNADNWGYEFQVKPGNAKEVVINNLGNMTLCWDDADNKVALYYSMYSETDGTVKELVECYNNGSPCPAFGGGGTATASDGSSRGYDSCYRIRQTNIPASVIGMRIYAVTGGVAWDTDGSEPVDSVTVAVFPTGNTLPDQGYKISSTGKIIEPTDIQRTVTVYKSFPYGIGLFDFALYSSGSL